VVQISVVMVLIICFGIIIINDIDVAFQKSKNFAVIANIFKSRLALQRSNDTYKRMKIG